MTQIYLYRCKACGARWEERREIAQRNIVDDCDECGGPCIREFSVPEIQVEGGTRKNHSKAQRKKEIPMHVRAYNRGLGLECTGSEACRIGSKRGYIEVGNEDPNPSPRPAPTKPEKCYIDPAWKPAGGRMKRPDDA